MNEVTLYNTVLPIPGACDYLAAAEPFFHADRVADFHVMIYVTEGTIYVTEDDIDYAIHEGELLFLKSGIRHYGKRETRRGTCWHFAHFYLPEPALDRLPTNNLDFNPAIPDGKTDIIPSKLLLPKMLTGLTDSTLARHIAEFTELFHSPADSQKWLIPTRLFQLLSEIAFYESPAAKAQTLSDRICSYLTEHYREPFSAAILEHEFFLSYQHMAAVFKKEKHLTMQQFHTQVRMNTACKLLRSTLLPIGEISASVGYSDMLYFSRCFHAATGMSPTAYRKRALIY